MEPEKEAAFGIRVNRLCWFLEAHFGDVEFHMPDEAAEDREEQSGTPALLVQLDEAGAEIDLATLVSWAIGPGVIGSN